MKRAMGSVVACGVTVAGAGLLLILRAQDTVPGSVAPLAAVEAMSTDRSGEDRAAAEGTLERVVFRAIATAKRKAQREAEIRMTRLGNGSWLPLAPSTTARGAEKGAPKRNEMARRLTEKWLAQIATAHGLTRDEINSVYKRGRLGGWDGSNPHAEARQ